MAEDKTYKWNTPAVMSNGDVCFTVRVPEYYARDLKSYADRKGENVEDYFQRGVDVGVQNDWFAI